ncbi:hypothetical protein CPL00368_CDS0067 [Klebsiella phage DevonBitter]
MKGRCTWLPSDRKDQVVTGAERPVHSQWPDE